MTTMTTYQKLRRAKDITETSRKQLAALLEALGGREKGWHGFISSEEVLAYLRDNDPAYKQVQTVSALVEMLGVKVDASDDILTEVRNIERQSYNKPRLDESRGREGF